MFILNFNRFETINLDFFEIVYFIYQNVFKLIKFD